MSSLEDSLRRILAVEGVRSAALIDLATGMVVQSAGDEPAALPAIADSLAQEARAAAAAQGPQQPGGGLDEIALNTAGRLQLTKVLDARRPGEGLLLFVDVDRTHANPALATLRIGQAAPSVLA
ncbi:MAG TPA: hypothetical protein VGI21_02420 [Streptosporangiaceae bacterium]